MIKHLMLILRIGHQEEEKKESVIEILFHRHFLELNCLWMREVEEVRSLVQMSKLIL